MQPAFRAKDESIPYSQKIWREIKFGGLVVYITIAKLKSAKISYSYIYIYIYIYVWQLNHQI